MQKSGKHPHSRSLPRMRADELELERGMQKSSTLSVSTSPSQHTSTPYEDQLKEQGRNGPRPSPVCLVITCMNATRNYQYVREVIGPFQNKRDAVEYLFGDGLLTNQILNDPYSPIVINDVTYSLVDIFTPSDDVQNMKPSTSAED